MDPRHPPVAIELNGTAAELLMKLMRDLRTEEPLAVLTRALGMLEHAMSAKDKGQRLGVYDPASGRFMDLVI